MKPEKTDLRGEKQAPTARDVYRTSTTGFRRRRFDRKSAGVVLCAAVFLLVIGASLFHIWTGKAHVTDRKAEIFENIDVHGDESMDESPDSPADLSDGSYDPN